MVKHLKYLKYVIKHKWYVFIECCKLGIPIRGILHDLSKFLPSEWFPYANYFYGKYPKKSEVVGAMKYWCTDWHKHTEEYIREQFSYAWLLHLKRNKHHWQWWILWNDSDGIECFEMPDKYRKEMLADWIGAGMAITGKKDINEWYNKNKSNITLHAKTKIWVEKTYR
jgi:hypothetical protein